jgi:hypothetical protein
MPQLPSIERTSLTTSLVDRYNAAKALGGPVGTAKLVGTDRATTNFINGTARGIAGWDVHSRNFMMNGEVPGFTSAATNYAKEVLKHDNTNYRG